MFTDFLYLLRSYGMKTSLNEWNSLMDALEMNLNDASLTEFYYMARAVLVKKESEYDKFDQAFLAYFKNVQTFEELPKEVLDWLAKAHAQTPYDKDEVDARFAGLDLDDIRKMMAERLKEQHEQHHGGEAKATADNAVIKQYNAKLAELETQRIDYLDKYTAKHPKVIETEDAIANLKSKLQQEIAKVASLQAPSDDPVHRWH